MRRCVLPLAVALVGLLAASPHGGQGTNALAWQEPGTVHSPPGMPQPPPRLPDIGLRDQRLTRLFTPAAAPAGVYEVFRSNRPIASLVADLRALDPAPRADAWRIAPMGPGDAFGSSAPYDAARVARLYVASFPLVARGSLHMAEGLVSVTLISPWPDADLDALEPGTMTIVFHVTRLLSRTRNAERGVRN